MNRKRVEIVCSSCGADTLLVRSAKYEGIKKVGETLKCASCGHEYASEDEVPFRGDGGRPRVFSDSDVSAKVDVFRNDEKGRICLHCANYVVNPFSQRCGLTFKAVEATDSCRQFSRKEEEQEGK